ncbi:hypothetical protein CBS101457_002852 [Exobasidium rhododendri]|nr:hypothetical protein CBS101457_002852 [Exobasidium rhododendri]
MASYHRPAPPKFVPPFKNRDDRPPEQQSDRSGLPPRRHTVRPRPAFTPIPTVRTEKPKDDPIAILSKKRARYDHFFSRLEAVLTKDRACDKEVMEKIKQFHDATRELCDLIKEVDKDEDRAKMDAFGTHLWNITIEILQTAGDELKDDVLRFVTSIRGIAVMQLRVAALGLGPVDYRTASRLVNVLSHTALNLLNVDDSEAQALLQECSRYLPSLHKIADDDSEAKVIAAEALTTHHCAMFALAQAINTGLPGNELEKAFRHCADANPGSWAYNETVYNGLQYCSRLIELGSSDDARRKSYHLAIPLLESAIQLMGDYPQYKAARFKATKDLAQYHYQLAIANNDVDHYNKAEKLLAEFGESCQGEGSETTLSRALLLRLEIMEQREADVGAIMTVWEAYAKLGDVRLSDVNQIVRLLGAKEHPSILEHSYNYSVCMLILEAILSRPSGDTQKMIGILLLCYFDSLTNSARCEEARNVLDLIDANELNLNEDISFACQKELFRLGDLNGYTGFYSLAGHHVFHAQPMNITKAWRKAAWCKIKTKDYKEALQMLENVPLNSVEMSATYTAKCIIFLRLKDEESAKASLEALINANDYDGQMLPLLIKEAQEARMIQFATLALEALMKIGSREDGEASLHQLLIIRTILKLHIDAAEKKGGFTKKTCDAILDVVKAAIKAVEVSAATDKDNSQEADVATWIFKVVYNISHEDKHSISPVQRATLSEHALDILFHRTEFSKPLDDESYHVKLWLSLQILTSALKCTEGLDASAEQEEYENTWWKVATASRCSFEGLRGAAAHNTSAATSLKGIDTALDVIYVNALVRVKRWQDMEDCIEYSKECSTSDAIEAMADMVTNQVEVPLSIRVAFIKLATDAFWDREQQKPKDVIRVASWVQQLIKSYMQAQEGEWEHDTLPAFQAVLNTMKTHEDVRRIWPKDNLSWMYTTASSYAGPGKPVPRNIL